MTSFRDRLAQRHAEHSARELLAASLGADPYERLEHLRQLGERKAEAEGRAYHMDHMRKVVLATIAGQLAEVHAKESLSEAKLERLARADERYRLHIEGTAQAMEERDRLQAEYWTVRAELTWDEKSIAHYNAMSRLQEAAP